MTSKTFDVELLPIDAIRPYEGNPRVNDQAVDAVAASLKEFGFRQPIVVDADGMIIVGHTRWKAAKKLGLGTVPVHVARDLTPEQIKAYRIADNQSATLAEWDYDLLPIELKDLQAVDYDLSLLGFDEKELAKLLDGDLTGGLTDPDDVPEPPDEATTRRGDLWILGDHRLLCGDATESGDVAWLMGEAKAQLVFTDPPYAVDYRGGRVGPEWEHKIRQDGEKYWDDMTTGAYEHLLSAALAHAHQRTDATAALYLWFASARVETVLTVVKAANWQQRNIIVWVKNTFAGSLFAQYKHRYEPVLYCHKTGKSPKWYGPNNEVTVWEHDKPHKNEGHPTVKPLLLATRALRNSSARGDIVLDMFLGSGTTLIAAEQMGRRCYGMEIEPRYCDVAIARWEAFTGKKAERLPATEIPESTPADSAGVEEVGG